MSENEATHRKGGWGGARRGAGRKRRDTKAVSFMATPEVEAILARLEAGTKSDYINRALLHYHAQEHAQEGR